MPIFKMLVGLPASGKSTYAESLVKDGWCLASSDQYRENMFGNADTQDHNAEVFQALFDDTVSALKATRNVVYDATNINYKRRKHLISELKRLAPNVRCECIMFATPYKDCLKYNAARERTVPESVIKNMYLNFYVPGYYEGWDGIEVKYNYNREDYGYYAFKKRMFISQDNSHHKLNLWEHLWAAHNYFAFNEEGYVYLNLAALFHDIGKPFTKSFTNFKGEPTTDAHYFSHHNVGAYDSLFHNYAREDKDRIYIANLIQWHMQPYFMESQKSKDKFKALVGETMYRDVMLLHEADEAAH